MVNSTQQKGKLRQTQVTKIEQFSTHLLRITLSGESLSDMSEQDIGSYFKLFVHQAGTTPDMRTTKRSYTIQHIDKTSGSLVFDAVIGRHQGPATQFVQQLNPGDTVFIAGPGPKKLQVLNAPAYLFIGDITSANAIRAYLTLIERRVTVRVYMMAPTAADAQRYQQDEFTPLHFSQHIEWIVNQEQADSTRQLMHSLKQLDLNPNIQVFMGCEAGCVREVKQYLTEEIKLSRTQMTATAYWKQGLNADDLAVERRNDAA